MTGRDYCLFIITCIAWGTSWFVIKTFQVETPIDPMLSVGYRFTFAGILMWVWLYGSKVWSRRNSSKTLDKQQLAIKNKQNLSWGDHGFIFFQALALFSLNYFLFYLASLYLTSGIIAFIFSLITFFNLFNGSIFLKKPFEAFLLIPILLGIIGLGLLFYTEFETFDFTGPKVVGLLLALAGTFIASIGNILGAYNQRRKISVATITSYGILYGGCFMLLLAWVLGKPFVFEFTISYIGGMLYLSVFSSIIAFYAYLNLIGSIGPERAAYNSLIFPVVAILISVAFEEYVLGWQGASGIVFVLFSNFLVFKTKQKKVAATL